MVYVYAKLSELNKYIGKSLTVLEIKKSLVDLGMDVKGESFDSDPELKIEITAERMDLISCVGIARAISYYRGIKKEPLKYIVIEGKNKVFVDDNLERIRPKIVCAIIRDVPMSEKFLNEIIEIQEKIHQSFGRNRKKAAIGIYPMENIAFPVKYGSKIPSQISFKPLGFDKLMDGNSILSKHDTGKAYAHLLKGVKRFPIIEDCNGNVLSMPPIINSQETGRVEITHKELFIECTGHNLTHLDNILKVITTSFIEMGCSCESVVVEFADKNTQNYTLSLEGICDSVKTEYVNRLIGINVLDEELGRLLEKMQFEVLSAKNGEINFKIPPFRSDIWNDCDVADDASRAYGFNNIELSIPNISSVGKTRKFTDFKNAFTQNMISLGFLELYTYILTSTKYQFDLMNLDQREEKFIRIEDSADDGINMTRTRVLPENLRALNINRKNKYPQKVFENGFAIAFNEKAETKSTDETHFCVSIVDPKSNYTQIKAIIDSIATLNGLNLEFERIVLPFLIEGRSAKIKFEGEEIGFIGELNPKIIRNFGLLVPVSSFEINLLKIFEILEKKN